MKRRKKRLQLSRRTLSNLSSERLSGANGAGWGCRRMMSMTSVPSVEQGCTDGGACTDGCESLQTCYTCAYSACC